MRLSLAMRTAAAAAIAVTAGSAHALALGVPALRGPARVAGPRMMASFAMPSFGGGPVDQGPSEDVLNKYRLMGLDVDAPFDEIEAAYETLAAKYKGNQKQIIKLQVAKDVILNDRLRARMSSQRGKSVLEQESRWDRAVEKKPLIQLPAWAEAIIDLPSRKLLIKNAIFFFLIGLLPAITASWASTSVGVGFAVSMYSLYNRGVPESKGPDEAQEMRPPQPKPLLIAAGVTLLAGMIGASLSPLIGATLLRGLAPEVAIGLSCAFGFFFSATFFKAQDNI